MTADEIIEACAVAAEAVDREGREWVRDSLWAQILKRAGDNVRKLKGTVPRAEYAYGARLQRALRKIADGEGYYGAQAREYKNIAREALGLERLP